MIIVKHELRQGRMAFLIWTVVIAFLLAVCVFLYPEMKAEIEGLGDMFGSMGALTTAFGMDRLNFGTMSGYYAIECGNVWGLGGAFFAALTAINMLSKEEKERTAEFLLTHPVSRARIITEKLAATLIQIVAMNIIIYLVSIGSMALVGEPVPWKDLNLIHLAFFFCQLELAGICFGLSAFLRRGSAGLGLGIAVLMYFLNLIANITTDAKPLKYITSFGYCEGADIISNGCLETRYVIIGLVLGCLGIAAAYAKYTKKDIV